MRGFHALRVSSSMTRYLTIFILLAILSGSAFAQLISFTPRRTYMVHAPEYTAQFVMDVRNLTSETQTVLISHYAIDVPNTWDVSMCTGSACYPSFIDSISYDIAANSADSLTLDIYADTTVGTGVAGMIVQIPGTADTFRVICTLVTTTESASDHVPNTYKMSSVYPNPFNSNTKVRFSLPTSGIVHLTMYNTLGRKIAQSGKLYSPGTNEISLGNWFTGLPSGLYFIHIETPVEQRTHRIEYIR